MEDPAMDRRDAPGAYAGSSSEAARASERMEALRREGSHDVSPTARRIIGLAIVLLIVLFFVAAFAGWIDVIPAA